MKLILVLAICFLVGCGESDNVPKTDEIPESSIDSQPSTGPLCEDLGVLACDGWHYEITAYHEPLNCNEPDFDDNVELLNSVEDMNGRYFQDYFYSFGFSVMKTAGIITFKESITKMVIADFEFIINHDLKELRVDMGCQYDFVYSLIPVFDPSGGGL